jgi:hypothetical protein
MTDFDGKPLNKYHIVTIYFEPIMESGERIAFVIAAYSVPLGAFALHDGIRDEVLQCCFGEQADHVRGILEMLKSSLNDFFQQHGSLYGWRSPLGGVLMGEISTTYSETLTGALNQAVRRTASLSSLIPQEEQNATP